MKKHLIYVQLFVILICTVNTLAVNIKWVYIDDPGVSGHESFAGLMSKYETTNTQYCEFLNAALASGDVIVDGDYAKGADGSNSGEDFVGEVYFVTSAADSTSQITFSGGSFSVRWRDGYDMSNHPVVRANWYGATAFCNYYGFRLPTEWEWQAIADYDGSYTYGCGTSIDHAKANYDQDNPLGLSSIPYTTPVDYYPSYGYGMHDMAANVFNWTNSVSGSSRVIRGGCWDYGDYCIDVSYRWFHPGGMSSRIGFRVVKIADPSLTAYWSFDDPNDVGYDDSGHGNDGTDYGTVWTNGRCTGALEFDGSSGEVTVPDSNSFELSTLTISCWIKTQPNSWRVGVVNKIREYQPNAGYALRLKYDKPWFTLSYATGGSSHMSGHVTADTNIADNKWHHVACLYDGFKMQMYVDGVLEAEEAYTDGFDNNDDPLRLGHFPYPYDDGQGNPPYVLNGILDEVQLYDRALSEEEIQELYEKCLTTYHVDTVGGDDGNDGLTKETAFEHIQTGIDATMDRDTVVVWPGVYEEECDFDGMPITVTSAADAAVVRNTSGYAFVFHNAEGPDSVLSNLVLSGGQYGIQANVNCEPTLKNLTIADNDNAGIACFENADPNITNCIFYNNPDGDLVNCTAKYSWVQEEISPVGYWTFDDPCDPGHDDSGNGNDGSLYGPVWTTGKVGGALDFDGSDYVDTSLIPSIYATASIWIYPEGNGGFLGTGYTTDGGKDGWSWGYNSVNDSVSIDFWKGNDRIDGYDIDTPDGSVPPSQWSLITVVVNDIDISVYVDGEISVTGTLSSSPDTHDRGLMIGRNFQSGAGAHTMVGKIDEVAIYDRALSEEDIQQLYANSSYGRGYMDPLFVDAENGDYHLLSERGRYWAEHDIFVLDHITSPCVDAGAPMDDPSTEPVPNGARINQGAYGGTAWASMSMSEWPLRHDTNHDGIVNFIDLVDLANEWLHTLDWAQ